MAGPDQLLVHDVMEFLTHAIELFQPYQAVANEIADIIVCVSIDWMIR